MTTFEEARRKARFGHRDWVAYEHDGQTVCEKMSRDAIKRALLAGGTKAGLTVIGASNAVLYRYSWRTALNMLRNYQHIYAA